MGRMTQQEWFPKKLGRFKLVLSSEVWGAGITRRGTIDCLGCGVALTRRLPHGIDSREVECWECNARYTMRLTSEHQVEFSPHQVCIPCISSGCEASDKLWESEMQSGRKWDCQACGTK